MFLIPSMLLGIRLLRACRPRRLSTSSWFLAACAVPVVSLYGVAAFDKGVSTSRGASWLDHLSRLRYRASYVGATDDGSSGA